MVLHQFRHYGEYLFFFKCYSHVLSDADQWESTQATTLSLLTVNPPSLSEDAITTSNWNCSSISEWEDRTGWFCFLRRSARTLRKPFYDFRRCVILPQRGQETHTSGFSAPGVKLYFPRSISKILSVSRFHGQSLDLIIALSLENFYPWKRLAFKTDLLLG